MGVSCFGLGSLASCSRDAELGRGRGHVMVHDPSGKVVVELRATDYGYLWAQRNGLRIGVTKQGVDAGEVHATDKVIDGHKRKVYFDRTGSEVRLFDEQRAPLGQISVKEGRTWAYAPGGRPLGNATADKDRVVLLGRDGDAAGYVQGLPPDSAAVFLIDGLDELERVVLALALSPRTDNSNTGSKESTNTKASP